MRDNQGQSVTEIPSYTRLEKGNDWSWVLGGFLLLALTSGLLYFYFQSRVLVDGKLALTVPQIAASIGILGLVLIFFLYALQKQKSISRIRDELIQRQVQEESLRSRLSELSVLFDVSGEANLQLELNSLLELVTRRILTCLEADRSSIFLIDPESGELICRAASGSGADTIKEVRIPKGKGIAGWVAENNEPLVLNDDETVSKFVSEDRPGRGISTALSVPLSSGDEVIGVLNLSRIVGVQPFTAADARLMTIFGEHAASAITRIRQYEALDLKAELLQQANANLARLNRAKQVFLATVNHELKGPLTIILAYAEFLARNESALDVQRRQSFAKILYEQAQRLKGITGQILNISRLEDMNVQLDCADTNLNDLVAEVVNDLEDEAAGRAVSVKVHLEPKVGRILVDRELLTQAFRMLFANVIVTTASNSTVHVLTESLADGVGIEVRGNGIDMEDAQANQVFTLFEGTEQREQSLLDGLGLGLYILRRVAELHGGRVRAKAIEGGGTSFGVVLPIESRSERAGGPQSLSSPKAA